MKREEPPVLAFEDIVFEVSTKRVSLLRKLANRTRQRCGRTLPLRSWRGYKRILDSISGDVYRGEFLAVLGPSGSGKTTLQDILSNRNAKRIRSGELRFMGKPIGPWIKPYVGYCKQEDILTATDTILETVEFSAFLRNRDRTKPTEDVVEHILARLNLSGVKDRAIGSLPGQMLHAGLKTGLSGGERRRTSLAVEIAASPQLLLCDEPTSGLDQVTATKILHLLRGLASGENGDPPIAVVATVHQPASQYWELFDRVLLLSRGRVFFFGAAADALPFFSRLGYRAPVRANPAEFLLQIASVDSQMEHEFPHSFRERYIFLPALAKQQQLHRLERRLRAQPAQASPLQARADSSADLVEETLARAPAVIDSAPPVLRKGPDELRLQPAPRRLPYARPFRAQLQMLLKRNFRQQVREPSGSVVLVLQFLILSLFAGTLFYDIGTSYDDIFNRVSVIFLTLITFSYGPSFSNSVHIIANRIVYFREHSVGTYRTIAYTLAYEGVLLVVQAASVAIYAPIVYWLVGLNSDFACFAVFALTLFVLLRCTMSFGAWTITLFANYEVGYALGGLFLTIYVILAGQFINLDSIPGAFIWLSYLSFFRWSFEALLINDFLGLVFTCDNTALCPADGAAVLAQLGFEDAAKDTITTNLLIVAGMSLAYSALTYVNLRFRRF